MGDRNEAGDIRSSAVAMGRQNVAVNRRDVSPQTRDDLIRELGLLEQEIVVAGHGGPVLDEVRALQADVDRTDVTPEALKSRWQWAKGGLAALQIGANVAQISSLVVQLLGS